MRALIRLVRLHFKDYSKENGTLRGAARQLSHVRDAQSIIESLDGLSKHFQPHLESKVFTPIRKELVTRRKQVADNKANLELKLDHFHARMMKIRRRCRKWHIPLANGSMLKTGSS